MLGLIIMVGAYHIALAKHQGVIVQDVDHLLRHVACGVLVDRRGTCVAVCLARLGIIIVAVYLHGRLLGSVIIEVEYVGTLARGVGGVDMSQGSRVDVVEVEGIVLGDEEGIVGLHGQQVVAEVHA